LVLLVEEEERELSDADVIVRMLYFCTEPRYPAQVMSYCWIDRSRFLKLSDHCIRRKLLKPIEMDVGLLGLVITEHGKETLSTAKEIMKELGIDERETLPPFSTD
jgi:hypothetical protein